MTLLRLLLLGAAAGLARGHGQAVEQKDDANLDAKGYAEQHVSAEAAFMCNWLIPLALIDASGASHVSIIIT